MDILELEEAPPPSDADLKKVATLAQRLVQIQNQQAKIAEMAKTLAEEYERISEADLPTAMSEIGMAEFKLLDGRKIGLETETTGSITKANQAKAFDWLKEHNADAIIKHEFKVEFGKGEDELSKKLRAFLELFFKEQPVKSKDFVHPQTLGAFVREQLKSDSEFPRDIFGVYQVTRAVIKSPAGGAKKSGETETL